MSKSPQQKEAKTLNADVEWPEGWDSAPISGIFDSWGGMTPSTTNRSYWTGKVPWISSKDVKNPRIKVGEDFITEKALRETRLRLCPIGSVLVVVRSGILANTLPITVTEAQVAINQDLKAFFSTEPALNEWLAISLRALEPKILAENRKDGTTVQSIRVDQLKELELPIPPLPEQQRIVERVSQVLADVELLNSRLSKIPKVIKRFRQAILAAACSGKLTEDWRRQNNPPEASELLRSVLEKRERLWLERHRGKTKRYVPPFKGNCDNATEMPDGWLSVTVSQVALLDVGYAFRSKEFSDTGIRLLRGENIEPGSLRWTDVRFWPASKVDGLEHLKIQAGDVILGMDRPIVSGGLKIARATTKDVPCLLVQRVTRFKMADPSLTNFLYYCLQTDKFIRHLSGGLTGSDLPHITGTVVAEFTFGLPSDEEQTEIVRRVEALFKLADAIEKRVAAAILRTDRLTQAILAKAFRGELVTTEAELARREGREYEPASVLLERIREEREKAEQKRPKRGKKGPRSRREAPV